MREIKALDHAPDGDDDDNDSLNRQKRDSKRVCVCVCVCVASSCFACRLSYTASFRGGRFICHLRGQQRGTSTCGTNIPASGRRSCSRIAPLVANLQFGQLAPQFVAFLLLFLLPASATKAAR